MTKNQTINVTTWLKKINARIVVPGGNGVYGTVTATANGTPISLPDGELFEYFTTLVFTCTPNTGYQFSHWYTNSGAVYDNPYTVIVNDANTTSASMIQLTAYFTTATGIDDVQDNVQCTKVIRDGQLLITRDGRTYNALGVEVK